MAGRATTISRRGLVQLGTAGALAAALSFPSSSPAAEPISIVDAAGRAIQLHRPARRLAITSSVHLLAVALMHDDPVSLIASLPAGGPGNDDAVRQIFRKRFPRIDTIATIGRDGRGDLPVERLVALEPDLVLFPLAQKPSDSLMKALDRFGIPVLILDFSVEALSATAPSIRMLGAAIGAQEKAEAYASFHERRLAELKARLAAETLTAPRVLVDVHAGTAPCCYSAAKGFTADILAFLGADNIAAGALPGVMGQLSPEYIVKRDPEIIIATGGSYSVGKGLSIGEGFGPEQALDSLRTVSSSTLIGSTTAAQSRRIFGLWHPLPSMPVNIVVAELFAKWLWPDQFGDLDPSGTLARINREFLATPMEDAYWIGPLGSQADRAKTP